MTSNGGVKNAEASTGATSNFDLYAGEFSCDDDISFENLLQLDNDIDKPPPPPPSTLSPASQLCRQPIPPVNATQPSSVAPVPLTDTVVYLLPTSALRPPAPSVGNTVYDAVARNDVRPLLRFQISKRPSTTTAVYGLELGGPIVTVGGTQQPRAPGMQTAAGCELASITSIGDRVAALPAVCPPSSDAQRRLALTTAFNGDLTAVAQRSIAAAVVAGTPAVGVRPMVKPNQPLSSAVGSKSKSSAAADARQTVQEKNAYEYERVMDILRYYRELVVERKLPGACLPCKRRKSKPLVSADPVTPISTRPGPLTASTAIIARTVAVPATQYVRSVAITAWRGQSPAPGLCMPTATSAGKPTAVASSSTGRPVAPQTPTNGDTSTMSSSAEHEFGGRTGELDPPSRPSSVELGTVQSYPLNDDLSNCIKDFTRTCSSAPSLCADDDDRLRSPLTVSDHKISLEPRWRPLSALGRRHRTLRRSVDLRRFVNKTPTFLHRYHKTGTGQNKMDREDGFQTKDETPDSNDSGVWMKQWPPMKHINTQTTDTVVVKWTKAHLAISGPYQSWT